MSSCRSTLPLYYPMNVYSTSKVSDAYPIPTKITRVFIASELGCDLPPDTGKPELFPGKRVVGGRCESLFVRPAICRSQA